MLFGALEDIFVDVMKARFEFTLLLDFVRSIDTSEPLVGSLHCWSKRLLIGSMPVAIFRPSGVSG